MGGNINTFKGKFQEYKDKLTKTIGLYRDAYGNMLDLSYEFTHNTIEEYNDHLETIKNEFLVAYNCNIIDYPKTLECFEAASRQMYT